MNGQFSKDYSGYHAKPRNSEMHIVVCVVTLTIFRVTAQTTIAPSLESTIAVGLAFYHHGIIWIGYKISYCHGKGKDLISSA